MYIKLKCKQLKKEKKININIVNKIVLKKENK